MREVIILAGGLGTRLQHLIPELPKALAPVAGSAFLDYVVDYLLHQKVDHFIFSLGYKHEKIIEHVAMKFPSLHVDFVIEDEPLGTGGAIQNSMQRVVSGHVFVINADTYFPISLDILEKEFFLHSAHIIVASKFMERPFRYGTILTNKNNRILNFKEKAPIEVGLINAGTYIIDVNTWKGNNKSGKFSFENEILAVNVDKWKIFSYPFYTFFIDIGVEEDFLRAQNIFKNIQLNNLNCAALFLDRDGIINTHLPGDYVKHWGEFKFCNGIFAFLKRAQTIFSHIFIVTNQQGVGKGIFSENDLQIIHEKMEDEFHKQGILLTRIYYCPHLASDHCNCRKPKAGMLLQAKQEFPDIELRKSYFIGDSNTDIMAGQAAGCITVGLNSENKQDLFGDMKPDILVQTLDEFFSQISRETDSISENKT